jgi:Protein of unknown function (DUF3892)
MPSQITCITKPDRYNHHEAITNVGGVRANGSSFYITREQCADDIRFRRDTYFVQVGRDHANVEAYQREHNGPWFIRTYPDHTQKDNLLSLRQC